MLSMDFRPRCKLGLILRFEALFAIPPGAAAIEIIANVRGADHRHVFTIAARNRKVKYSTIFLIFHMYRAERRRGVFLCRSFDCAYDSAQRARITL